MDKVWLAPESSAPNTNTGTQQKFHVLVSEFIGTALAPLATPHPVNESIGAGDSPSHTF